MTSGRARCTTERFLTARSIAIISLLPFGTRTEEDGSGEKYFFTDTKIRAGIASSDSAEIVTGEERERIAQERRQVLSKKSSYRSMALSLGSSDVLIQIVATRHKNPMRFHMYCDSILDFSGRLLVN